METRFGEIAEIYSARGLPTYFVEAFHDGLMKHVILRAVTQGFLRSKMESTAERWNMLWARQTTAEKKILRTYEQKEIRRLRIEQGKDIAAERTSEAQRLMDALDAILVNDLDVDPALDWEQLKDRAPFPARPPTPPIPPKAPERPPPPPRAEGPPMPVLEVAPERSSFRYWVKFSLLDHIVSSRKELKLAGASDRFDMDHAIWKDSYDAAMNAWRAECESNAALWNEACAAQEVQHGLALDVHKVACAKLREAHAEAIREWTASKAAYDAQQKEQHASIDATMARYLSGDPDAVLEYCERVLAHPEYPSCIPREFDFDLKDSGILIVNCRLPAPVDMPKLLEVKYVQVTDSKVEKTLSESQAARLYDDTIYKLALRALHDLFRADTANAIAAIVMNGVVTSIDKSTGNEATACIISIQVSRETFLSINLAKVDPKACFRQLKGVGSSKMHSVTPVAPIAEVNRSDRRFVAAHAVAENLSEGFNLATMDWEDFEPEL